MITLKEFIGGQKELKAFFKDPLSLTVPIIQVLFSLSIAQRSDGTFDEQSIKQELAHRNYKNASYDLGSWGFYPYFTISVPEKNNPIYLAYVGLNEQNGTVLLFNLIIPKTPNGKDLAMKLWETFINETTELPEPLLLKATGQEMHLGYTIVDVVERKIRVIAEKRNRIKKYDLLLFLKIKP